MCLSALAPNAAKRRGRVTIALFKQRRDLTPFGSIGFLFFGELHLVPHLLPIALAVARRADAPRVMLFVATSVHEEIIRDAMDSLACANISIERVRGFLQLEPGRRDNPRLPWKPLVMALNAARIFRNDAVVVAERTSLWMPMLNPGRTPFIYNEHGAAPHANFKARRNRYATRILMPSEGMAARARAAGSPHKPIRVVGYIKRDYVRRLTSRAAMPRFPDERPTVVYVPH